MSLRVLCTRLGSAPDDQTIEPSCGVMDVYDGSVHIRRVVVDCGCIPIHSGVPFGRRSWLLPDLAFFKDSRPIDAVCITHVHGDHSGALALLIPYLSPTARIWMTMPSYASFQAYLEADLKSALKSERRGGRRETLGSAAEIVQVEPRIHPIAKPGEYEILPGLRAYVHPEGHVRGACSFTFRVGGRNIHYAGDRCSHDQPGIKGGRPLPEAWRPHVIAASDCTYGADLESDARSWDSEMRKGRELVREAVARRAPVLCCAFGVHRGSAIVHGLQELGLSELLLDGACRIHTKIAMSEQGSWSDSDTPLDIGNARFVMGEERDGLAKDGEPRVVVSTPGMGGPGGAASAWKGELLPNPDALVLFASGYLAKGSDGARIMAAVAERERTGVAPVLDFEGRDERGPMVESLAVACRVAQIRTGGHDSRADILRWFGQYKPETAVLCHGSSAALASVASELRGFIPNLVIGVRTLEIDI